MRASKSRTGIHRGFTLIELLVVVGIIVVLVGILLPVVGGARDSARAASTKSTMVNLSNAVRQFKADKGRLPGFFSVEELAGAGNLQGLTQMESSLYDLAGGILKETPTTRSESMFDITMGSQRIVVDYAAIGSSTGPGYLTPSDAFFRVPSVQDISAERLNGSAEEQIGLMPLIVDGWGVPMIMWMRNESAGNAAPFSAVQSLGGAKAQFYWAANRGVLASLRGENNSLMDRRAATRSPSDIEATLDAILGHTAFPDRNQTPIRPAAPLGDVVFHSANKDQVFIEKRSDDTSVWYEPRRNPSADPPDPAGIEAYNDLIQPGG